MQTKHTLIKMFEVFLFTVYCLFLAYIFFWMRTPMSVYKYNLIPFATIFEMSGVIVDSSKPSLLSLVNLVGNALLFVPFGFFLPLIFNRVRNWKSVFALSSLTIIFVEVVQFCTKLGIGDIDDFMLNLAGAMLGYILYVGIRFDIIEESRSYRG